MITHLLLSGSLLASGLIPENWIPAGIKRWMGSPRAATARGIEAFQAGEFDQAVAPLTAALDAAPDDAQRQFNAGTAELGNGDAGDALPLLEEAARRFGEQGAPATTTADALYNLGNARLANGDAAGAVEAFKQSLRTQPTHGDAKVNLELALRQLEEENQAKSPQESPEGGEQGEQEQADKDGQGDQADQQQQPDPQSQPDPGNNEQQQPQPQPGDPPPQPPQEQRLPNFQEQEDMSAEQAAAILEAVENLEREARRAEAAKRAAQRPGEERDW